MDIDAVRSASVQQSEVTEPAEYLGSSILDVLIRARETIPPWWSKSRDIELRKFYAKCDYLSGAINALVSKVTTIPFIVVPRDVTIERHVIQAQERTDNLYNVSHFYKGWNYCYGRFLLDFWTQDNGGFMEVLGEGRPDGPIVGMPLGLAHLDSQRCTRTSNPEWPVIYTSKHNEKFKLHYTRVIEASSLPSSDANKNGVGLSATSRAINIAQSLYDILIFEQEKLGSRPERAIIYGNVSGEHMRDAIMKSQEINDNLGLTRYSKYTYVGTRRSEDVKLDKLNLAEVPDGFDKRTSIELGMYAIALAFGVDARELWPATQSGATKGDAAIQHLKSRGKGIGEIIQITERLINQKFLPPYLTLKFDFQDDEQDALQADIHNIRSQANERNINSGLQTIRVAREQQLERGEITPAQFEQMELEDGRLSDGTDITLLLYSDDPDIQDYIKGGDKIIAQVDDNPKAALKTIKNKLQEIGKVYVNTKHEKAKMKIRCVMAAWKWLQSQCEENLMVEEVKAAMEEEQAAQEEAGKTKPNRNTAQRPKLRRPNPQAARSTRILRA